VFFGKNRST